MQIGDVKHHHHTYKKGMQEKRNESLRRRNTGFGKSTGDCNTGHAL